MQKKNQNGFTLLELCFTIALTIILLLSAIASFNYLFQKNAMLTLKDHLETAIHYAKNYAWSHECSVYLSSLPGKINWNAGVALYDAKSSKLLHQWHWKYSTWTINWKGFESNEHLLIAGHPLHAASNGEILIQNHVTGEGMKLVVNRMARVEHQVISQV